MPYAARILVPTDFSPLSALALDHAVALASLCRASIHLVDIPGTYVFDDRQLVMRGALQEDVKVIHKHDHAPISNTGAGVLVLENAFI